MKPNNENSKNADGSQRFLFQMGFNFFHQKQKLLRKSFYIVFKMVNVTLVDENLVKEKSIIESECKDRSWKSDQIRNFCDTPVIDIVR